MSVSVSDGKTSERPFGTGSTDTVTAIVDDRFFVVVGEKGTMLEDSCLIVLTASELEEA